MSTLLRQHLHAVRERKLFKSPYPKKAPRDTQNKPAGNNVRARVYCPRHICCCKLISVEVDMYDVPHSQRETFGMNPTGSPRGTPTACAQSASSAELGTRGSQLRARQLGSSSQLLWNTRSGSEVTRSNIIKWDKLRYTHTVVVSGMHRYSYHSVMCG